MKHERIKSMMTAAAEATIRGDSDAVAKTERALAELAQIGANLHRARNQLANIYQAVPPRSALNSTIVSIRDAVTEALHHMPTTKADL